MTVPLVGSSPTDDSEEREVEEAETAGESNGEFPFDVAAESAVAVRLVVGLDLKPVVAMVQRCQEDVLQSGAGVIQLNDPKTTLGWRRTRTGRNGGEERREKEDAGVKRLGRDGKNIGERRR